MCDQVTFECIERAMLEIVNGSAIVQFVVLTIIMLPLTMRIVRAVKRATTPDDYYSREPTETNFPYREVTTLHSALPAKLNSYECPYCGTIYLDAPTKCQNCGAPNREIVKNA